MLHLLNKRSNHHSKIDSDTNTLDEVMLDAITKFDEWICPDCNTKHDRDFNASINIKKQGLKILSGLGTNSDIKQKHSEALPLGESATYEAHPISFAVGG